MRQSIVRNVSHPRSVEVSKTDDTHAPDGSTIQETIARRVSRRARRRLLVAILPLLFMMAVLAYVLVR